MVVIVSYFRMSLFIVCIFLYYYWFSLCLVNVGNMLDFVISESIMIVRSVFICGVGSYEEV